MSVMTARHTAAKAFTLVELLVAMAIMLAVAGIAVYVLDVRKHDVVNDGASALQGWLQGAQQRALRDGVPTGVRLQLSLPWTVSLGSQASGSFTLTYKGQTTSAMVYNASYTVVQTAFSALSTVGGNATVSGPASGGPPYTITFTGPLANNAGAIMANFSALSSPANASLSSAVTQCVYVRNSDDWSKGSVAIARVGAGSGGDNYTATLSGNGPDGNPATFADGFDSIPALWAVQIGDFIEIGTTASGANNVYVVTALSNTTTASLFGPTGLATLSATTNFRVMRQPRPYSGEPPLQLPPGVIVDIGTNGAYGGPLPVNPSTNQVEIVFAPSGAVIGAGTGTNIALPGGTPGSSNIQLWLRDSREDPVSGTTNMFNGQQRLVTVVPRVGSVLANAVDTTPNGTGRYQDPYSFTRSAAGSLP